MSTQHQYLSNYESNLLSEFRKNSEPICTYCKKVILVHINKNDLTVDHKTPISRGGKTVYSNLAIACLKCNQEKANMTVKEYKRFKKLQSELVKSLDADRLANAAIDIFSQVIEKSQIANINYNKAEKELQRLIVDIASRSHTAANCLQTLNNLKDIILQRDNLKMQKETLNLLCALVTPWKAQLEKAKIKEGILQESYNKLKDKCIDKSKDLNRKIIMLPDGADTAEENIEAVKIS